MTVKGVDISEVQQNVDFNWLVNQGIQFVIVKCYTGNDGKDPFYEKNVAAAKAAGLKVGIYHFIYPLPTDPAHPGRDAISQARAHYQAAGDQQVVCCDLEWPEPQDWAKWKCTGAQITQWTLDYLAEYERISGVRPIIYTYYFYGKYLNLPTVFNQYKLWDANFSHPPMIPPPWTDWAMQQEGGGTTGVTMRLPNGIPVDTDLAKDLSLWDQASSAPAVAVVPVPPVEVLAPTPVPVPTLVPAPAPSGNIFTSILQLIAKLFGSKS